MPPLQSIHRGGDVSHPTDLVRALAASPERLFELLERVPFGVIGLAADGKSAWGNLATRSLLPPDTDLALPPLLRALLGETVRQDRIRIGQLILEVSAAPIHD